MIISRILQTLRNDCRMGPEDLIIAGVSGGMDSIFLLTQLLEIGQPVIAVCFNHNLRPEAEEEIHFVNDFCKKKDILCISGHADIKALAEETGDGIEEIARQMRYSFLFGAAEKCKASAVATAHHANDQAETVLLHVLRGSGIDGLCGMRPYSLPNAFSETFPLIRPLLGITRPEIESYIQEHEIPYREDCSNSDPAYTRNRIRLDLIPKLAADYNPQIINGLCRLAETAAADKEILDEDCADILKYGAYRLTENGAEWDIRSYYSQPIGLRLRLLRKILTDLKADLSDIGYQNLKDSDIFFMTARYNQTMQLNGELWLRREGDKALILNNLNIVQQKYPQISQGWQLVIETREINEKEVQVWMRKAKEHPETAILDANQLVSDPFLRTIQPGERFHPYGNGGKGQKLSDFLINNKVPKEYRGDLAVAADASGIVWIPGMRIAQRCAVGEHTHRIMILKIKK